MAIEIRSTLAFTKNSLENIIRAATGIQRGYCHRLPLPSCTPAGVVQTVLSALLSSSPLATQLSLRYPLWPHRSLLKSSCLSTQELRRQGRSQSCGSLVDTRRVDLYRKETIRLKSRISKRQAPALFELVKNNILKLLVIVVLLGGSFPGV